MSNTSWISETLPAGAKTNWTPSFLLAASTAFTAVGCEGVVGFHFARAGVDLKPEHEVHNVGHDNINDRIDSRDPAYTKCYLPDSVTARPVKGEVPTLDLIVAYHKANNSPILKLFLPVSASSLGHHPSCPCVGSRSTLLVEANIP